MKEKDTHVTLPIERYEHLIKIEKASLTEGTYFHVLKSDYKDTYPFSPFTVEFAQIHTNNEAVKLLTDEVNKLEVSVTRYRRKIDALTKDLQMGENRIKGLESTVDFLKDESVKHKENKFLGLFRKKD